MNRPIRVVMFGSGPALTHDAREFLGLLESHPDVHLLAAFCQAGSRSLSAVVQDLWKRRGILAIPLLVAWMVGGIGRFIAGPRAEMASRRSLAKISERLHFVTDIHAPEVLDTLTSLAPDLGLIYGSPILRPELFEIPRLGTLGIHHGKLPEYRGNKTTFWAIYNGEERAGVTIQKVNAGLDTGQIVREGDVTIGRRSQRSVWRELEALGLELYVQAILEVKAGTAAFRRQDGPKGRLYKNPKLGDFMRFWYVQLRRRFVNVWSRDEPAPLTVKPNGKNVGAG